MESEISAATVANPLEEEEPEGNDEAGDEKNAPCPGNPSGYTRLFLGNLPFAVDEHSLRDFLAPAVMTHVKWITDKETGKFYGSGFVEIATCRDAAIATTEKNGEIDLDFFRDSSFSPP